MWGFIKYLSDHRDWVFSGIGVATLGVVYKVIRYIFSTKKKDATNHSQIHVNISPKTESGNIDMSGSEYSLEKHIHNGSCKRKFTLVDK